MAAVLDRVRDGGRRRVGLHGVQDLRLGLRRQQVVEDALAAEQRRAVVPLCRLGEPAGGGLRLLLAPCHHAQERAVAHHLDHAGHGLDRAKIGGDEARGISRRPGDGAEQHAGGPQIVDEHLLPEHLGRNVDARIGGADDPLLGRALAPRGHVDGARQRDLAGGLAIAHALAGGAQHPAVLDPDIGLGCTPQACAATRDQRGARVGAGEAQRGAAELDRQRAGGGALVRRLPVSPEISTSRSGATSSSSAATWRMAVRMPWPSSTRPVMTVTVPSGAIAHPGVEPGIAPDHGRHGAARPAGPARRPSGSRW